MARKPRVHFPGALYHVIARGNQRQKIFRSNSDRSRYLELLNEYRQRYAFNLFAYVLMGNHVHLLMEAGQIPLSKSLQGLQQSYTSYFNRKYQLVGHLFQGRYKAILCDRDSYLLELVRYIQLNPVRSKLVKDPADYPWSSHRFYLSNAGGNDGLIRTDVILSQFSRQRSEAVRAYKAFVRDGLAQGHREEFYAAKEQRYLGDDRFVEQLAQRIERDQPAPLRTNLEEIEKAVCLHYELPLDLLRARNKERRGSFGRLVVAYLGQELGSIKLNAIAARYGRDQVSVSLGLKRLREAIARDAALRRSVENLMGRLQKKSGRNK